MAPIGLRLWVSGLSRRLLSPAWPSWSSADARLAKLCLWGGRPVPPTPSFGGPGGVLSGVKIEVMFGCVFVASLHATEGFGHVFFGPASSAQLGLRFSFLATSTYLGFWGGLEASYVWCQEGIWGPKQAP